MWYVYVHVHRTSFRKEGIIRWYPHSGLLIISLWTRIILPHVHPHVVYCNWVKFRLYRFICYEKGCSYKTNIWTDGRTGCFLYDSKTLFAVGLKSSTSTIHTLSSALLVFHTRPVQRFSLSQVQEPFYPWVFVQIPAPSSILQHLLYQVWKEGGAQCRRKRMKRHVYKFPW